ncbi:cob(I)yrinic acid a,c-diamide adenosyltransferase [Mariniluteicoccus endophyticus]
MVVLNRIYTRTGDAGETRLSDMSLTRKTDPRVAAYGDTDETNSHIGVALATGVPADVAEVLRVVQNELFDVGADLSNPLVAEPKHEPLRILPESVERLERWCDEFGDDLPTLRSFILPGGTPAAAHLHVARTACRRAERSAWVATEAYGTEASTDQNTPGGVNPVAVRYLNRLSDLLFVLTRYLNGAENEVLWVPGGERSTKADQTSDGASGAEASD